MPVIAPVKAIQPGATPGWIVPGYIRGETLSLAFMPEVGVPWSRQR